MNSGNTLAAALSAHPFDFRDLFNGATVTDSQIEIRPPSPKVIPYDLIIDGRVGVHKVNGRVFVIFREVRLIRTDEITDVPYRPVFHVARQFAQHETIDLILVPRIVGFPVIDKAGAVIFDD